MSLLTCGINITSVNCKAITKHKYNTKIAHTQNKNNMAAVGKTNINEVPWQKPKSLKKQKSLLKNSTD